MSFSTKLRILHVFNHLMLIPAFYSGSWWMWLGAFLWWNVLGTVGISACFHRLLAHRSFQAPPWFEKLGLFLGCLATGGTPLGWAGVHRQHHRYVDGPNDPHSPHAIGFLNSYLHLWKRRSIERRFVKDLIRNPTVRFLHRHYFPVLLAWMVLLYAVDFRLGIFVYSIPSVIAFHAYGFINAFGHLWGYRNYDTRDDSRNNWLVNVLTCGEGWHNNHHRFPSHYRIGFKSWEWDPAARLIEILGFHLDKPKTHPNN